MSNEITARPPMDLSPQNFEQALEFSKYLARSDLVPKDYKGKPENCLIAMQWGAEVGLKPLQAIQNLAVINGRPALWGDSVIAIARSSPLCEYVIETDDGKVATCKVKRRGEPEQIRTFSAEDAVKAGLSGKAGPWTQYPKRMRQMRARAFALRDVFPDVLRGLPVAEEVMDIPDEKHMGPADVVQPEPAFYADEKFTQNFHKWEASIQAGKHDADYVIDFIAARGSPFTEAQKARLRAVQPKPAAPEITDAGTVVTYAEVADELQNSGDTDDLNAAADLIGAVSDAKQRAELAAMYEKRAAEFGGEKA